MANIFLKPGNPLLRKISQNIPKSQISSNEIRNIIKKMLSIAQGEQGDSSKPIMVGLAAPQIGISKRIILVDLKSDGAGKVGDLRFFINPQIIWISKKESEWYEGCYSIPEVCGIVKRPSVIKIKALTEDGKNKKQKFEGYTARIFQHEINHLDGKFFVDFIDNPNNLHMVKPEEFRLYRNKKAWKNWPKKASLPLALRRLKKV